jgi:lysophospholipase L1-like esterase
MHETAAKPLWAIPWESYRPNSSLDLKVGDDQFVVQINSLGYRTHEYSVKKPPGTFRVVCVGGSTTFQGRSNDETYPAILEARLRQKYPNLTIEVLNLGISGIQSGFWLSREQALFELEPDVVLQYEGVNDIAWRALPAYAKSHTWTTRARTRRLAQHLFPLDPRKLDTEYETTIGNLRQMANLCHKHGAIHFAASFAAPDYGRAPEDFRQYLDVNTAGWTKDTFPLSNFREYARLIERYNSFFVQAMQAGQVHGPLIHRDITNPDWFVDLCHFTQDGINRMAEAFLPAVSEVIDTRAQAPSSTGGG